MLARYPSPGPFPASPFQTVRAHFRHTAYRWSFSTRHARRRDTTEVPGHPLDVTPVGRQDLKHACPTPLGPLPQRPVEFSHFAYRVVGACAHALVLPPIRLHDQSRGPSLEALITPFLGVGSEEARRLNAPPSAAQTARAGFPHAAFTKARHMAASARKESVTPGSPAPTRHAAAPSGASSTPNSATACGGATTAVAPPTGQAG